MSASPVAGLCAFGKRAQGSNGYTMSWNRSGKSLARATREAVTEFHIVGGLHPELTLDWFCEMLRGLKERFPRCT